MGPGNAPYVTRAQMAQYMPAPVLALFADSVIDQACIDATCEADEYLRGRYALPLLAWSSSITMHTASIVYFKLAKKLGFAPQAGADKLITEGYWRATDWPGDPNMGFFGRVQRQAIHPDVTPSIAQPGDAVRDLPQVRTTTQRGWQHVVNGRQVVG